MSIPMFSSAWNADAEVINCHTNRLLTLHPLDHTREQELDKVLQMHSISFKTPMPYEDRLMYLLNHCISGFCHATSGIFCKHFHHYQGPDSVARDVCTSYLSNRFIDNDSLALICRVIGLRAVPAQADRRRYLRDHIAQYRNSLDSANSVLDTPQFFSRSYFYALPVPGLIQVARKHGVVASGSKSDHISAIFTHVGSGLCLQSPYDGCRRVCAEALAKYRPATDDEPPELTMTYHLLHLFDCALQSTSKHALRAFLNIYGAPEPSEQARVEDLLHVVQEMRSVFEHLVGDRGMQLADEQMARRDAALSNIRSTWPHPPSASRKLELIRNFRAATSSAALRHRTCASCGESVPILDITSLKQEAVNLSPLLRSAVRDVDLPLPPPVTSCHGLSQFVLDPAGVINEPDGITCTLEFCSRCMHSLSQNQTPRLSLANSLYPGPIPPELLELSPVEESLIARCRSKCTIVQLQYDEMLSAASQSPINQRAVRGNVIVFPQHPDFLPPKLPPPLEEILSYICVVFVGSQLPDREWFQKYASPLVVRPDRVRAALLWLKANDRLYRDVQVDANCLSSLPSNGSLLPFHIEHLMPDAQRDATTSRYDAQGDADVLNVVEDGAIPFSSIVVANIGQNATSRELRAAAIKHVKENKGSFLAMPHDSSPTNEFDNPLLFPSLYPTLFPYGVGGLEDPSRRIPVSFKNHVRHLLSLADTRFQTHHSFLFTAFNVLQRRSMLLSVALKTRHSWFEKIATTLNSISSDVVHRIAERLTDNSTAFELQSDEERSVMNLLKEVQSVSRNVAGSNSSRLYMRNEIRAMIASLGVPSFFITLNPADVYSPVVKFLAGADIDVDNLLPDQVPKYWDQASLVAKNPFVAAKFFNVYMKAFISHLLAYKQPTAGDFLDDSRSGIVGITKGYYGCVEAQGRGTLHCHMLVWVEGSISPNQLKAKLMEVNNDHFRDTYTRYMEDCISTSLPPLSEEGVKVPSDDHHPCSVRGVDLNNPSVDDLSAQRAKDLYNIVKHCQAHAHRATCYKYWRGPPEPKECRFGLGEAAINPASTIDPDTGEFNLRHLDGSVNNYNDTIIEATRCNCDIKGIASGDKAKAILYYITDYISKSQLKAHVAFAALESALRKLEARAPNSENTSASAHGKSLLQKCAYEMLSRQELSGQQIASYLMEYGDHYTSHTFRRLFWTSAERYIEECLPSPECNASCSSGPGEALHATGPNELPALDNDMDDAQILRATHAPQPASLDDEVVLDIDNEGTVVPRASQLRDYIYRGTMLDSVSLWNFIARVEKVKFSGGKKTLDSVKRDIGKWKDHDILQTSSVDRPRSLLSQDHDEYKLSFHSVVHPLHGYIPVPIGPALPRRDRPASHARYCRLMLTFFKPWRTASDLRGSSASWEDAFDDFRNSPACSSAVLEIMDNMQVFHECKDSRDEHFRRRLKGHKNPIPQFHNDNSTSSLNASLDDTLSSHDNADEEALLLQHLMSIQAKQSILEKARDQKVQSFLDTAADNGIVSRPNMLAYVPLLEQRQVSTSSKHIDISQSGNALEQTWQAAYRDRRKRWKMDLTKPSGAPAAAPPPIPPAQTSPNADQLQTPVVIAPSPDILQDNERLCDFVAKKWTLNESQNLAFTVAARNILEPSDEPLRMLIAGPAGTGKSRVIDALKDLFDLRKQGDRCVVASYMGIAARNVKGITIHAALNLNNLARMKLYGDTHQALIKFWEGKDTLVIDEVSMVGLQLNGQINQGLQLAKENNRPYGGINIIFAGDFAQLPPPGQTKLFASLSTSYLCAKTTGQQVIHGKLLWLSMNKVVMLSKPERQDGAANERFVELLSRLREGKCNSEDYDVLCTRVLSPDHASLFQDRSSPWKASPIIVTDNATKDALNEACAIQFALDNEQELHWYHARDLRSGKEIENVEICKLLQTYDSGKTKQRLGRIPLCIGMPVLVAQNFDVQGGVVNGSRGVVKSLRYCHDLQGRRVLTSCIVNIPNSTQEVMPGLEAHDMPIIADSVNISLQIPFTHESITIERQQVAIVPAFSMTAHRAQGQTLEHVVIDLEACNGSEAPYVMLSRATALSGVFIFRPFLRKRIMNPQSDDMLIEMHRLRMLSLETALEYGSNEQKEKAEQELLAIELQTKGRPSFTVLSTEDISKLGKSRKKIAEIVTRAQDEASHSYSLMNVDASASTVSRKRKRKQLVPDE